MDIFNDLREKLSQSLRPSLSESSGRPDGSSSLAFQPPSLNEPQYFVRNHPDDPERLPDGQVAEKDTRKYRRPSVMSQLDALRSREVTWGFAESLARADQARRLLSALDNAQESYADAAGKVFAADMKFGKAVLRCAQVMSVVKKERLDLARDNFGGEDSGCGEVDIFETVSLQKCLGVAECTMSKEEELFISRMRVMIREKEQDFEKMFSETLALRNRLELLMGPGKKVKDYELLAAELSGPRLVEEKDPTRKTCLKLMRMAEALPKFVARGVEDYAILFCLKRLEQRAKVTGMYVEPAKEASVWQTRQREIASLEEDSESTQSQDAAPAITASKFVSSSLDQAGPSSSIRISRDARNLESQQDAATDSAEIDDDEDDGLVLLE